jgi:hypothetical protein
MRALAYFIASVSTAMSLLLSGELPCSAASVHFKGDSDLQFDCERPIHVREHAIHVDYTAALNSDKTAVADFAIIGIFTDKVHFDMKLGGSVNGPNGATIARVMAQNRLRVIWDLPNNQLVLDLTVAGRSCSANLSINLKRGKQEYTVSDGYQMYYCSSQKVLRTSCEVS